MYDINIVSKEEINEEIRKTKIKYKNIINIRYSENKYVMCLIQKYKDGFRWIVKDLENIYGKSRKFDTIEETIEDSNYYFEFAIKQSSKNLIIVDKSLKDKLDIGQEEMEYNKQLLVEQTKQQSKYYDTSHINFPIHIKSSLNNYIYNLDAFKNKKEVMQIKHILSEKQLVNNYIHLFKLVVKKMNINLKDIEYFDANLELGNLGPNYIIMRNKEKIEIDLYEYIDNDENQDEINMLMENEELLFGLDERIIEKKIKKESQKILKKYK